MDNPAQPPPDDVADELNITKAQVYALIRRGDLDPIKIGGRGQWRVERDRLEDYITRLYDETRSWVAHHPFTERGGQDGESDDVRGE